MFDYKPPQSTPDIIYCDDDILLVNKPAELLSVPGRLPEHQDCLISRLQQHHPEALIIHRLDMSTSGLMIIARNKTSQRNIGLQFEQRQVKKTYQAVVNGRFDQVEGQIKLPLSRDWPNRPRQRVDQSAGKPAQTNYRVVRYDVTTDTSMVELKPTTGRTHQLRVHMQALGHPILGDDLYADEVTFHKAKRLLLHASALEYTHPTSGKRMIFSLEAPF